MIPYGKRHPVVLRWIPIKNLSGLYQGFYLSHLTQLVRQMHVEYAAKVLNARILASGCLGCAAVMASDFDTAFVGSIPGRGVIRALRSTQPSIPPW